MRSNGASIHMAESKSPSIVNISTRQRTLVKICGKHDAPDTEVSSKKVVQDISISHAVE